MNYAFPLFMLGMGTFIALIIWLDHRSLGRRRIKDTDAAAFLNSAWARWTIDSETAVRGQGTERTGRFVRVKEILRRNFRLTLFCVAGIFVLFGLLVLLGLYQGRLDARDLYGSLLGALFFSLMFSSLILFVTGIVIVDALGWRMMLTFIGVYDTTPRDIAFARDGILYLPGGLQRFTYVLRDAAVIAGEVSVLKIVTGDSVGSGKNRGWRQQDFYVAIPKGHEAEAQILADRLLRGH